MVQAQLAILLTFALILLMILFQQGGIKHIPTCSVQFLYKDIIHNVTYMYTSTCTPIIQPYMYMYLLSIVHKEVIRTAYYTTRTNQTPAELPVDK